MPGSESIKTLVKSHWTKLLTGNPPMYPMGSTEQRFWLLLEVRKHIQFSEIKYSLYNFFFVPSFPTWTALFIVSTLPPDYKYLLFTGVPQYTATGTIVLTMQGVNDNCPTINTALRKVCMHSPSVVITAKSVNGDLYGLPFTFSIHGEPQTTWIIRSINGKLNYIL